MKMKNLLVTSVAVLGCLGIHSAWAGHFRASERPLSRYEQHLRQKRTSQNASKINKETKNAITLGAEFRTSGGWNRGEQAAAGGVAARLASLEGKTSKEQTIALKNAQAKMKETQEAHAQRVKDATTQGGVAAAQAEQKQIAAEKRAETSAAYRAQMTRAQDQAYRTQQANKENEALAIRTQNEAKNPNPLLKDDQGLNWTKSADGKWVFQKR